ncbi:TetR/AcrR family transcriptional regulator [Catenulispora sp. NL8]|uniref:TetR/AcrR family transcriptional regulator n=2 Tax=Catenulispora pinistramenti TaxID=2705254 RepID=A0ABS5KT79_9ACTN|nr:TetR/AcrR family transcriptional regulator [Catenulispora pinistramenti]MBS2549246.1 TetR/AcrR family transcriptional regulator [Catenulispora pinistramenti]
MDPDTLPTPLPRGNHGLSREDVSAAQRGRLLTGMLEVVAERGYAAATVGAVLSRAHISRQTFYEHFADKQDCFLAAFDRSADNFARLIEQSLGSPADPPLSRLDRILEAYLGALAGNPTNARVFMIEIYAAGYPAVSRRLARAETFAMVLAEAVTIGRHWRGGLDPLFVARSVTGAVSGLVTEQINSGDIAGLPELRPRIVALVAALLEGEDA